MSWPDPEINCPNLRLEKEVVNKQWSDGEHVYYIIDSYLYASSFAGWGETSPSISTKRSTLAANAPSVKHVGCFHFSPFVWRGRSLRQSLSKKRWPLYSTAGVVPFQAASIARRVNPDFVHEAGIPRPQSWQAPSGGFRQAARLGDV